MNQRIKFILSVIFLSICLAMPSILIYVTLKHDIKSLKQTQYEQTKFDETVTEYINGHTEGEEQL